jgi:hypothetical protein
MSEGLGIKGLREGLEVDMERGPCRWDLLLRAEEQGPPDDDGGPSDQGPDEDYRDGHPSRS